MRPCKILCTYDCHLESILEYHKKGLKLLRWGVFGLPLTHRVKILQKKVWNIMHHTSYITHHIWVVLMVTHGETASCFTKIRKVSRKNQFSLLCIKDRKRQLKIIITRFFCLKKNNLCVFFIFHCGNSRRIFYHFLVSINKMLSKSNIFIAISIFFFAKSILYILFFCINYFRTYLQKQIRI